MFVAEMGEIGASGADLVNKVWEGLVPGPWGRASYELGHFGTRRFQGWRGTLLQDLGHFGTRAWRWHR